MAIQIRGKLLLVKHDKDGQFLWQELRHNMVVNAGKGKVSALVGGIEQNVFKYLAIGSGTTAVSATDTALEKEFDITCGGARKVAVVKTATTEVPNDTLQLDATWVFTRDTEVSELAIFNSDTGGDMLSRQVGAPRHFAAGESLHLIYHVIFG